MTDAPRPITVAEYEGLARARTDPGAWDYQAGGAGDEVSLGDNRAAWDRIRVRPRVMVDVSSRDLSTSAFGVPLPHPIVVAPTAAHQLSHPDAECGTARGSAAAGALYTLSTISSVSMEDVAVAAPGAPRWFQLYAPADRGACKALVERAVAAGYGAVAVTVDLPLPGNRERDRRNRFEIDLGVHLPPDQPVDPETGIIVVPTMNWEELGWLRGVCPIPLIAKGVLRADDASRAVDAGCDGVWVSNHGGRQLDTAIAAIDALPEIVDAVGDRALLVVDGGVRRGVDALKALAIGASLVAVGRPILWGLAVDGAGGVQRVLEILRDELSLSMALAGCRSIDEVTGDLIA
ncbi:MAG TPA: alpha-hydroxy acid oxidase [Candidatus Limnocylindria bacterium]|nr:alpha-hydroxy acid oxidase [Candidatus Limnocylindria bacterium]